MPRPALLSRRRKRILLPPRWKKGIVVDTPIKVNFLPEFTQTKETRHFARVCGSPVAAVAGPDYGISNHDHQSLAKTAYRWKLGPLSSP
jgi:hypothetical protein